MGPTVGCCCLKRFDSKVRCASDVEKSFGFETTAQRIDVASEAGFVAGFAAALA